jgi:DNA-binding CsgD family transcriptional regulator
VRKNDLAHAVAGQEARELLDLFPVGVILLSPTSRVIAANRGAQRILAERDGLSLQEQRLLAAYPRETRELHALVRAAAANGAGELADGRSAKPLSRPSGRRPLQTLIARLGANGGPVAGHPSAIALFVADPEERVEIPADRLRRLYGLTSSEARIASCVAAGLRPEDVAQELGVQTNTVRMHLKRVFAKTRTRRQSELVGLLLGGPARLSTG